ncbi:MAG TPA: hypothetical protein VIS72_11985 [Anaerolineales bacterium]
MEKSKSPRVYPPVYERLIPIALWTIGIVVAILLVITIVVALTY